MHFTLPVWSHVFYYIIGSFEGNRKNCTEAMERSYPLLVFPGGSKEVWRKKGYQKYSLEWEERSGFARMAIQYGLFSILLSGNISH